MIEQASTCLTGWARFSDDERMRYRLTRAFSPTRHAQEKRVVFCMLNPSTADAFVLDPTVRRCAGFARTWGADVLEVVNIFALRSTDPKALYTTSERGDCELADEEIVQACENADIVIAAWGKHGALRGRAAKVRELIERWCKPELHYLKLNKDGSPAHPLYLKAELKPQVWR